MYTKITYKLTFLVEIVFILVLFEPMITDLFVIIQVQLKEVVTNYNDLFLKLLWWSGSNIMI